MDLRPIVPSVIPPDRQIRRMPPPEAAPLRAQLRSLERSVLDEYNWRCAFCGYHEEGPVAKRLLDYEDGGVNLASQLGMIALNGDYSDVQPQNFEVCCVFCRAALEINEIDDPDTWAIALLPGFGQHMISWISRAAILGQAISDDLGIARENGQTVDWVEAGAEASYRATLEHLSSDVMDGVNKTRPFSMCSSVEQFGNALSRMQANDPQRYARRGELLAGFRLVPQDLYNVGGWDHFARYTRLMLEASGMSAMNSYRSILTAARQVFVSIHKEAFPDGDPIQMTDLIGKG